MANLGAWHLSDRPEIYEPMRNNTFELVVHDIENLQRAGVNDGTDIIKDGQETIRFAVNKVSIPNFTQSTIEIRRSNTVVKFAGPMSFENGSMEVIDYIGADSKSVLMAWQALSGNINTEAVGRAKDYKKRATLIEYTPDFKPVRYWDLTGCWLSSVSNDEVNQEGGDSKRTISATLVYDKAIMRMEAEENYL